MARECDVIALQEVTEIYRPFNIKLMEQGFELYLIVPANSIKFSTAIALRESMFDLVVNNSIVSNTRDKNAHRQPIYGQEIASVYARIKNTTHEIALASLHSWGFQLYADEKEERKYSERDKTRIAAGLEYTKEAIESLKGKRFKVFAGDMNNNPHNQAGQFELIEKEGFEVLKSNEPTNINGREKYRDREIDFIYVPKMPLLKRIGLAVVNFFVEKVYMTYSSAQVLKSFDFTFEGNCSDHKPVVTTLIIHGPSTFSRIYHFVGNCFNSCFKKPKMV